jgi:heme/copper-type cytochrome/quinol oxidase subunit 3
MAPQSTAAKSTAQSAGKIRQLPVRQRRPGFGDRPPHGGSEGEEPFISNGRLAVLMLLATEAMLFSGFIGSFIVFRNAAAFWPPPGLPRLPLFVTEINTVVLLSSALTMNLAVRRIRANKSGQLKRWLAVTAMLGTTFLAIQGSEWARLLAHGLKMSSGTYGATFYTLIGCHGLHVVGAVIWLLIIFGGALRGRYNQRNHAAVEICAIYWYFVCAVWPVLFFLVYL